MERVWLESHRVRMVARMQAHRHREQSWSLARLLTFVAAAAGWVPVRGHSVAVWGVVGGGLLAFTYAVIRHLRARHHRILAERHVALIDEATRRHGGHLVVIRAAAPAAGGADVPEIHTPRRVATLGDQELDDLDVYATPVGLFGLLNRTSTAVGATRLQRWIEHLCLDRDDILARQDAVRWLTDHDAERFELMTACAGLRDQQHYLNAAIAAVDGAHHLPWPPGRITALRVWSVLTLLGCAGCGVAVMFGQLLVGLVILAIIQINALIYLPLRKPLATALAPWRSLRVVLRHLELVATTVEAILPHEGLLGRLQRLGSAAAPRFHQLRRRVSWTDTGGLFYVLSNLILFYDVHVASRILRVAVPNRSDLLQACGAVAELEALCSLACFAAEQPVGAVPDVVEGVTLRVTGGRHPLVEPVIVTPNDVRLDARQRLWIITGSNMAGKSTFLRMAATQVVLAQLGTVVTAEAMAWSPVRLLTDLRIRDSIGKEESYFMAEVRQLRRMVLEDPTARPLLGLIDEPFRGTNSDERVAASIALVDHLRDHGGTFLVATHERAITELADGVTMANYHFSETEGADEVFDHVLRPGPAQVRNALRIMEREGYPASLLQRTHAWLDEIS